MSVVCLRTKLQLFPLSSVVSSLSGQLHRAMLAYRLFSHHLGMSIALQKVRQGDLTSHGTGCLEVGLEDLYPIPAPKC
jgi:hypothetical protein